MNCPRCGAQIIENEKYCRGCGSEIILNNNQNSYINPLNDIYNTSINNYSNNKYKLTLKRKKSIVGCAVAFDVFIDDILVGKIKNGKTLEVEVTAGIHKILVGKKNAIDKSVNDNALNIEINGDTEALVAVLGYGNFNITNVSGSSKILDNNKNGDRSLNKIEKSANNAIITSISIPVVFVILLAIDFFTYYIWALFGLGIGLPLINLYGLKNYNNLDGKTKKNIIIKNILALFISIVATIVCAYIAIEGKYI